MILKTMKKVHKKQPRKSLRGLVFSGAPGGTRTPAIIQEAPSFCLRIAANSKANKGKPK
jgi:hypothetical protein